MIKPNGRSTQIAPPATIPMLNADKPRRSKSPTLNGSWLEQSVKLEFVKAELLKIKNNL